MRIDQSSKRTEPPKPYKSEVPSSKKEEARAPNRKYFKPASVEKIEVRRVAAKIYRQKALNSKER